MADAGILREKPETYTLTRVVSKMRMRLIDNSRFEGCKTRKLR